MAPCEGVDGDSSVSLLMGCGRAGSGLSLAVQLVKVVCPPLLRPSSPWPTQSPRTQREVGSAIVAPIIQGSERLELPIRWLEVAVGAEAAALFLTALAAFLKLTGTEAGALLMPSESPELNPPSLSGSPFFPAHPLLYPPSHHFSVFSLLTFHLSSLSHPFLFSSLGPPVSLFSFLPPPLSPFSTSPVWDRLLPSLSNRSPPSFLLSQGSHPVWLS